MSPSQACLMVLLAGALAAEAAHASDRPKLPRGARCWSCDRAQSAQSAQSGLSAAAAPPDAADPYQNHLFDFPDVGDGFVGAAERAEVELADGADGFPLRLARRVAPSWPLRHPALALDARKRHRTPDFQHPNVRFVNNHYFNDLGGPYGGGEDSWEEPKPMLDNRIRDRNLDKAAKLMTAEELIQALRDKGRDGRDWAAKDDEDDSRAMALRFGTVGKK